MTTNPARITEENFKDIDPSILMQPQRYDDMERMVISIDAAQAPDYARDYALIMSEKLRPVLDSMTEDLRDRYSRLQKALLLYSLITMKDVGKIQFFQQSIVDVAQLDFIDLHYWVENCFRSYFRDRDTIEHFRRLFIKALEENTETIGTQNLKMGDKNRIVPPTVRNWLTEYNSLAHLRESDRTRGGFERAQYLANAQNPRSLSEADRKILSVIVELYDWLKFSPLKYDFSLPDARPLINEILEGEDHEIISQELSEQMNKIISQRPNIVEEERQPYQITQKFTIPDESESNTQAKGSLGLPNQGTEAIIKRQPSRPLNIQDILMNKKGKGGGIQSTPQGQLTRNQVKPAPPVQPPSPPPAPRPAPFAPPRAPQAAPSAARPTAPAPPKPPASAVQDEIAKKLAELKNRSSQNNSQKK